MFSLRLKDLVTALESSIFSTSEGLVTENQAFEMFRELLMGQVSQGGIVYVIGNGGSAGIASHFSTDLMRALHIPSQTMYDSNLITCISNDLGYENVFSYPLEKCMKPKDLLVAISSSGKSSNILRGVKVALSKNVPVVTFSGFSKENPLRTMGFLNFFINRSDYGLVETAHFFLLHTIVDRWDQIRN